MWSREPICVAFDDRYCCVGGERAESVRYVRQGYSCFRQSLPMPTRKTSRSLQNRDFGVTVSPNRCVGIERPNIEPVGSGRSQTDKREACRLRTPTSIGT